MDIRRLGLVVFLVLPLGILGSQDLSFEPPAAPSAPGTEESPGLVTPEPLLPSAEEVAAPLPEKKEDLVVAYYGHPNSRYMGILGRFSIPEIVERVKATAQKYQELAPDRNVVPALYLIYGTAQPQGRIGYLSTAKVMEYINYTADKGVHIILDHQIGTHTLQAAVDRLLPFLQHPHVHMAFDVEWRTDRPMETIGWITGDELNWMQGYVSDYLQKNQIPDHKYIVFHQFKASMVRQAEKITTDYPQVEVIHSTSGWGPPSMKLGTHAANARITQLPSKGFKLWYYYSDKPGIHYDAPLMPPEQVMKLNPLPKMIIYQ